MNEAGNVFFWKKIPFANNCGDEYYSLGICIWQAFVPESCVNDPFPHTPEQMLFACLLVFMWHKLIYLSGEPQFFSH